MIKHAACKPKNHQKITMNLKLVKNIRDLREKTKLKVHTPILKLAMVESLWVKKNVKKFLMQLDKKPRIPQVTLISSNVNKKGQGNLGS